MVTTKVFTATQARDNFYKILKLVQSGTQVVIEKTDTGEKFEIKRSEESPKRDVADLLDRFSKIGLKAPSEKNLRELVLSKYD